MDAKTLLICLTAVIVSAVSGCPVGQEFLTTFLTNYNSSPGKLKLAITAHEKTATVNVWSPDFTETKTVPKGATAFINLPAKAELSGPGLSNKIVRISSDSDITVVTSNIKSFTGDSSVILPTSNLGRKYVVFTPDPKILSALVALVNGDKENVVEILPAANMKVNEGNQWKRGRKVTIKLKPNEVYQFMSRTSFTGTRITSTLPLAVLVGNQCAKLEGTCEHVYEQLLPVERLSDHYLVPAMGKKGQDYAYVVAADDKTTVYITGKQQRALHAGQKLEIPMRPGNPVIVRSNKKVMVMYFGRNLPHDEFLTNILPISEMSNTWSVYPQETYENTAVIVSEAKGSNTIKGVTNWRPFPSDSRYVWAMKDLGRKKNPESICGQALMAVYVFGGKTRHGYGTTGVCTTVVEPTSPPDPCDDITCREKEECKRGVCVHTSEETCSALGDPHYRTFDGKRYDFQGTCTYTMAEVLKKEAGLVPFTILAKNNHRGNKWVAYVRKVTVTVYNHTVTISKKRARVEVDGEIVYLPVSLAGGKLQVVQRGRYAVLTTKFGLKVTYDWNMMLRITAPSSYFRTLGGLCGNYNGDRKDEWTSRSRSRLSSALEFAKSWKVADTDLFCHDNCRGKCPSCSPKQKKKFSGVKYCGLITDTNSVFAKCIPKVDPGMYFDNCVYDICINKGIKRFLCDNIENYVDACMAAGIKIDGWRTHANCPMDCPANSHYEACGPACAASCAERNAPSTCKEPCVEGCQCNKGFVLSGETCVPVSSCGCTSGGRYYPPGQTFWADNTCTKKCTCTSGTLQCVATKCKSSEVCSLRNGVRNCYPLSYGTCRGSGDPHYRSFDGKRFDFQGTCTYFLSKVISTTDPSLEPFEVQVQNENRGRNKAVAYTKTALIEVYEHTIILSSDNPGRVKLNNVFVNLPLTLDNGRLSIFRRGRAGVVKTEFGLEMQFDWRSYVSVTVPSTYHGVLGGLCGNFNGHGNDDMLTPNKTPAKNPTEFGQSWKVKNDSRCKDTCEGKKCEKCDINSKQNKPFRKHCSILTDKTGPFKDCHSKVNPEQYYEDCVYDMCMYKGHSSALCNALSTYTSVCQDAKARIDVWRTESLCPLACKGNSHYEVCPSSCSVMCRGTEEPEGCENTPCSEGCECDDGFVLSDGQCVPEEQCGCAHKGLYYQQGQVFFLNEQCKGRCVCGNDGKVQCQHDFSCGPDEECRIQDGIKDCFPTTEATCSVSGTGHYHSFDNKDFSVPGNCVYKMAEVTQDNGGKRVPFSVVVHQESAANDPTVTRSVQIEVSDYNIVMLPGRIWEVMLDNIRVNLPLQLDDGKVQVYQNGFVIILQTNFGLEVTYDTISIVRVELPSSYKGVLLGLCGNYNGNPADDFALPGGAQVSSAEAFAEGWVVDQEGVKCQTGCGSQCPTPTPGGGDLCNILKDKKSPFSKCHSTVPPQEYFDKCVKDLSEQGGSEDVLCQHLQNYVAVCQESGGSVDSWRNKTFCSMRCPKNSQYELCADTCSTTCASLTTPQKCSHCQEGCECEDGFAFDGGECKPLGKCGCVVDGRTYKSGETVVSEDCLQKCTCADGVFSCEKTNECTTEQVCDIQEGVRNCYQVVVEPTPPPDPCDDITCREKEECKRGVCVHTSEETCSALGDPHYRTFDGKRYDFQGTCTYTMAEVLKKEAGLVPFTVLAKNNHRGNKWVAYVRKVTVTVYNHTVTINKKRGRVEVDGEIVYLPVSLAGGKLQVVQRGRNAVLTTKFGLKVTYDWNMMLRITAPSSYFRTLGGLCGNYNGDRKDEWTSRSGSRLSSALEFAKSWKVADTDLFCHDNCRGKCPSCSPKQKKKFSGVKYCGLITDTNSVFAKCIPKVDPGMYFDNCVYDICINKGIKRFLCDNIENYVDACMAAGIKIDGWRTHANCPMDCPANSHYEACGPACAASCAERNAPSTCKEPCVEGCQCNKGFVLSGETCVPVSSCGCTSGGRYYPPGQKFWADNTCTKKCTCTSGTLQCVATKCKSSEVCSLRNGVRNCYPLSYGTCRGSGDPHYRSFDGKRFDFQGTCTYFLSKVISTTDPSLEPFEVQVQNENRGRNKAVAYTKTALIEVYEHTIILSSDNPGRVKLNNVFVNLPLTLDNGRLSIFRRGRAGVVKTEFGLEMQFDWRSYVSVTVPSTYHGVLGGLCGNFNGHGNDDMLTPNKTPAKNPTEFGQSWKVKNDSRCKDTCEGKKCEKCDINSKQNKPFRKHCSILTDKTGPFKDCHSKVNPEQYYEDCVYDMCMYKGHSSALCNALSTYTSVCQEVKARIDVWRTESLCPLACKGNSHYEVCPSSCSAMCPGNEQPEGCENTPCSEGCECDDGFVLSDGQCVPEEQCGCAHKGLYYQQGQVFFLNDQCKGRCVCGNDGKVRCQQDFSCGPDEMCRIQDGIKDCFPTTEATCSVSGTGHYHSFDSKDFSVPGNCVYKMAEVTQDNGGKRVPFSVVVHQESAANDPTVTRSVQIEVSDYNIVMLPGRIWEVMLDDIRVNLPLQLDDGKVQVYQNGFVIILQTNFGLEVTYDTISIVRVELPSSYKGVLLGLCGNYNGNLADDFALPGGAQASSAEAFAEGWVVDQKGVKCQTGCGPQCPTPTPGGGDLCNILKDKKSPFSKCHSTVPPQEYFDKCVKDLSEQGGSEDVLCQHLQNYVAVCQESGGSVDSWRNESFCPMKCPKNSQYELCADTCSTTCASLTTPQKCSHCQEGCECEDGFAFDGGECKPLGKCGCVVDGRTYKSGETVVSEDCLQKCTCADGVFSCEKTKGCIVKQVCAIREGLRNCYQVDPCKEKNCRVKEMCVKNGSNVQCVAKSSSTCHIIGDPHYQSFDGKLFSYQGSCTYTLVQTTGLDDTLTPFSIVTKTEMESKHRGAYLKTVTVNMEGVQIVVVYGDPGKVLVDGSTSNLPVTLKSGRIRITQESYKGFIKTDFGVEITFDWGEDLHVTVPSSYYKNLEGMCGTYNGDQADDFSIPNGSTITSLKKWAEAWSLPEANSTCLHSCPGQCPVCTADDKALYEKKEYCGEIGLKNGAFAACHAKVLPEKLLADCLYNMCIHEGDKGMLCKVMTNYAKICQRKEV